LKPRKALNKAFLKVKPNRSEIEHFKTNLIQLLDNIKDKESEEFHKNLVIEFLKKTYYDPNHFINTKGRNDLVIHNGQNANSTVGVIIEAKKPTNKAEMLTRENINKKAFQELVLYYLRERITHKNLEVKHLVATNIYEWFIFDATLFDRLFAQNKNLVKQFNDFEAGRLADTKTDFFYKQIAEPFIDSITSEIEFTYFNIQDYYITHGLNRGQLAKDDNSLIALFKLLSPEHLLKLPFTNDSNSLDKRFYSELLHIIGLTETKEGGKKLIERNKEGERNTGTILEDAIIQLDSLDKLSRLPNPNQYGNTQEERLFNVALELSITWINRILFLKLLEAQLINYHKFDKHTASKGDKSYSFLHIDKVKNYDDLNSLFFQVLARKYEERNEDVKKAFEKVPYLNSSLFEPTELEQITLFISNLKDDKTIPIFSQTVLKDQQGKKRTGNISTLQYLFEFLDAYDFGAEGGEEIQEDNKTLINASVLGLIFEKINGYKDGSFFTPGFITMYMCRETIRKAVVQKFKQDFQDYRINRIEDIYELIPQKISRKKANEIVNSIKICDPACGSGHFLVSALNEMIAIKNDLKILEDKEGKSLHRYEVEVVNDELIVTDENGELFEYNPGSAGSPNRESQRIQETLFHEKQTIIENCLFGVDINPNSVKICRLRLWIELLKNAYYKQDLTGFENLSGLRSLETLPNIDINIKCGNSLVSRFAIDADLKQALKKSKWTIDSYRIAVDTYRNAQNKEQKREMERLITAIKSDFRTEISKNDPKIKRKAMLAGELYNLTMQQGLFAESDAQKKERQEKIAKIETELNKLETEIEEIKSNKIFENAFEWRFEFPEVLNDEGDFVGFDVVIGNPPYIQLQAMKEVSEQLKRFEYQTYEKTGDIYSLFYERGNQILKQNGFLAYITSNKWMRAGYGKTTRNYFLENTQPELLIDLGSGIFEEATVDSSILIFSKKSYTKAFKALDISKEKQVQHIEAYHNKFLLINPKKDQSWTIASEIEQSIRAKIERIGKPLKEWDIQINYGIKTGYNEAFIIDGKKKDELIAQDPKSAEIIKPILRGRDIKRYKAEFADLWLINTHNGVKDKNIPRIDVVKDYPAIYKHLLQYETQLKKRQDKGDHWTNLRNCAYIEEFEKEKIIYPNMTLFLPFIFDDKGYYTNQKCFIITSKTVDLKFLIGFFNSKLSHRWIRENCPELQGGTRELSKIFFENIPIPPLSPTEQQPFIDLVEQILAKKEKGEDTTDLEKQIDQLVYQLYELTEEEIAIIENSCK
jgi:type II restriction/modification system DNA methylase subunit YeeA